MIQTSLINGKFEWRPAANLVAISATMVSTTFNKSNGFCVCKFCVIVVINMFLLRRNNEENLV